jgi:hypothetical protein
MNNRNVFLACFIILVLVLIVDPAFCGITDGQIKAASKSFTGAMHDWTPAVIGGGLLVSGMLIFANNYKAGLSGIAATAFIYAAKAFTGTGEACLVITAPQVVFEAPVQMTLLPVERATAKRTNSVENIDGSN